MFPPSAWPTKKKIAMRIPHTDKPKKHGLFGGFGKKKKSLLDTPQEAKNAESSEDDILAEMVGEEDGSVLSTPVRPFGEFEDATDLSEIESAVEKAAKVSESLRKEKTPIDFESEPEEKKKSDIGDEFEYTFGEEIPTYQEKSISKETEDSFFEKGLFEENEQDDEIESGVDSGLNEKSKSIESESKYDAGSIDESFSETESSKSERVESVQSEESDIDDWGSEWEDDDWLSDEKQDVKESHEDEWEDISSESEQVEVIEPIIPIESPATKPITPPVVPVESIKPIEHVKPVKQITPPVVSSKPIIPVAPVEPVHISEMVSEVAKEPVKESVKRSIEEPVKEPVKKSVEEPVKKSESSVYEPHVQDSFDFDENLGIPTANLDFGKRSKGITSDADTGIKISVPDSLINNLGETVQEFEQAKQELKPKVIKQIVETPVFVNQGGALSRFQRIHNHKDKAVFLVTGDRRSGVSTLALLMANQFAGHLNTLFVDLDTSHFGAKLNLGIEELNTERDTIRNSLCNIKDSADIEDFAFDSHTVKFKCLLSLDRRVVTDDQFRTIQNALILQEKYDVIVIDCPFENLVKIEDLFYYSDVVCCVEETQSAVINTVDFLSNLDMDRRFQVVMFQKLWYVSTVCGEGKLPQVFDDVNSMFDFDTSTCGRKIDWLEKGKIAGTFGNIDNMKDLNGIIKKILM